MSMFRINLKPVVAATLGAVFIPAASAWAQDAQDAQADAEAPAAMVEEAPLGPPDLSILFERLAEADEVDAARLTREIELEWSKSGSPAMDLLLKRGREAMKREDYGAAVEHFGALTDHAPEFAEGWHGHAQAMAHVGKFGVAIADLQQVLIREPRHYDALFGLGLIFEQIDRPDDAFEAYEMVLAINPHHEGALDGVKRVKKDVSGADL